MSKQEPNEEVRKEIIQELDEILANYDHGKAELTTGLTFSVKQRIKSTLYYSNSSYLNGNLDELGREKPFYNNTNSNLKVTKTATDLDTKDIVPEADDSMNYGKSFVLSKDIYQWMKTSNFKSTLNDMNEARVRYGGILAKKCKKDGKLKIEVPEWKNLVVDHDDIMANPIDEIHPNMSISELSKYSDVWNVDDALKWARKYKVRKVIVHEVRGYFPEVWADPAAKKSKEYTYQYHAIAEVKGKKFCLYAENNSEEVYRYCARIKRPGAENSLGVGVPEESEQAQVAINNVILKMNSAMELSTKVVSQSASRRLKGRNLLNEVENGTILETDANAPITQVPLAPSGGFSQFQEALTMWVDQAKSATATYDAVRGEDAPSGTPFRLQALNYQAGQSQFQQEQEDFGNFVTDLFNDWVIPEISAHLNSEHILSHDFTAEELQEIDRNYAVAQANAEAKRRILSGKIVTGEEYDSFIDQYKDFIRQTKTHRFLEIPKDFYKDIQLKVTINITGEQKNKAAMLESISNIITLYSTNPNLTQDPVLSQLFYKLVELSGCGISPVQLMAAAQMQKPQVNDPTVQGSPAPASPDALSMDANPTKNEQVARVLA